MQERDVGRTLSTGRSTAAEMVHYAAFFEIPESQCAVSGDLQAACSRC
jgi:hypothetical protein